ncbi:hypothetical protein, partial [Rhodoblastus acidophilus]|uniref:hypothetical protein n=1 Tax=Rhodoblastus acidophilus TaxID=1074 RepID=UPI00222435DB
SVAGVGEMLPHRKLAGAVRHIVHIMRVPRNRRRKTKKQRGEPKASNSQSNHKKTHREIRWACFEHDWRTIWARPEKG